MDTNRHELLRITFVRHPGRSEGSKRLVNIRPFPWILRFAQDDGCGECNRVRVNPCLSVVKRGSFQK